ncbi:MAG TPA: DUF4404 family protein [Acidimicrobiia bacterium]
MEQHLRHLLDELKAAIGRTTEGDQSREELTRLHGDVERRLESGEDEEHNGLVDRLEKAEIRFESDHPSLGASIRQAVQSLTAGGI